MSAKYLGCGVVLCLVTNWSWIAPATHAELVAQWKLNEGSGDVFADSVVGNDGFLPVNVPPDVPFLPDDIEVEWVTDDGPPGIQDTSVMFLGEASYIETPFPGIGGTDPRTITAWVKAPPQPTASVMVAWGAHDNGRRWHFRIDDGTGALRTEYKSGQNVAETDITDEEWHFVASVFPDGAEFGSEIIHYVDGEVDEFAFGNDQPIDTLIGDAGGPWPAQLEGLNAWPVLIGFGPCCGSEDQDRSFFGQLADVRIYDEELDQEALQAIMLGQDGGGVTQLQAGDANMDYEFNQLDLVQVQIAAKYLTGQAATWGDGDWDAAPGGEPGNPPQGNGFFDQLDIIAALGAGKYLTGPYAAVATGGTAGDGQTSIIYNPGTGEVAVDAPAGTDLTSINIDSAASIFTGSPAENLGGSFDNDADNNIFKATFGSSFGSLSLGNVAQTGLSEDFVANDLTVVGSLNGGGDLGAVDLIYVPEPSAVLLLTLGVVGLLAARRRR